MTITKPDNSTDVKGPSNSYVADGTAWFEYVPEQIGTYKLKFDFGGTYFPAGRYNDGVIVTSGGTSYPTTWFKPASTAEQTLVVQSEQVASWPAAPLPRDYWARPISPEKREWDAIAGNYPWSYFNEARDWLGPFVTAPNTAHVAWKQSQMIAGLIGGETGSYSISGRDFQDPGVILAGRLYMTYPKPGVGNVAGCYDLRTGAVIYEIPESEGGVTPYIISYVEGTSAVPGAIPSLTPELIAAARLGNYGTRTISGRLIKINPWTGMVTLNVSIAPVTTGIFHSNQYVISVQDLGASQGANRYRLINWTTQGSSTNFSSRIISNISYPISNIPSLVDYDRSVAVQVNRFGTGAVYGGNLFAIDLKSGQVLWNITTDPETPFSSGCASIDEGKVAVVFEDRSWRAYDLVSGKLAWRSEQIDYPWGVFWSYDASSWNGMLYAGAYTGVYAFDWATGKTVWKFAARSVPFETPYADLYSFHSATIVADGKLYTYSSEHTPSEPITRGWKFYCLNATTGDNLWEFAGSGIDSRRFRGCAADGYLTVSNAYDGNMYVFGKGKSATTVEAPLTAVPKGIALTIQGSVLDLSSAQPNTPCVSKDSMTTQMQYLHMQSPIDGIWHNETITGVPVSLTAIASDGSSTNIGTIITDGYYGTFSKTWVPPTEGDYKIIASFTGDDSYGSSSAATAVVVGPATPTPTNPENPAQTDYSPLLYGIVVLVVIAIIIGIVAILLVLRRR